MRKAGRTRIRRCGRALRGSLRAPRHPAKAPEPAQHLGVAPLPLRAARTQLAANELVLSLELREYGLDVAAEVLVRSSCREGPAAPRVPEDERLERVVAALEEDLRQAAGRHHAEGVAVAAGVLRCDQPFLDAEPRAVGAPFRLQHRGVRLVELARPQVSPQPQQVMQLVRVPRLAAQLTLDVCD